MTEEKPESSKWNSTPEFARRKRLPISLMVIGLGVVLIAAGLYSLVDESFFYFKAQALTEPIIEVQLRPVPRTKGSEVAYVPIVTVPSAAGRMAVDTYSKQNIYVVGTMMKVLCDVSDGGKCIENTLVGKWGQSAQTLGLGAVLLLTAFAYRRWLS